MVRSGCKEFKERFALLNGRCIFYKHVLGKMDCYSTSRNYLKLRVISQVATAWQCPPKPRCPLICVFSGCEGHSQCLQACQMTKNPLVWEKVKIHRVELCFNGTKINFLWSTNLELWKMDCLWRAYSWLGKMLIEWVDGGGKARTRQGHAGLWVFWNHCREQKLRWAKPIISPQFLFGPGAQWFLKNHLLPHVEYSGGQGLGENGMGS